MLIIDACGGIGYRKQALHRAQEFFQQQFPELVGLIGLSNQQDRYVQASLLSWFRGGSSSFDALSRAGAGLCLRCYTSHFIKEACVKLFSQFGENYHFTVSDLLPFVLNDDGKTQILLESDGKSQLILDDDGTTQKSSYRVFSIEILQKFNPSSWTEGSLASWTYYQTRQNNELKTFLFQEHDLRLHSDWAILNRATPEQLKRLGHPGDGNLLQAFHAVYRRDRHQQPQSGRCPDPTEDQLNEMLDYLQGCRASIHSSEDLMRLLKRVAKQLRTPLTKPLEVRNPRTGEVVSPEPADEHSTNALDEVEQQEWQEFCEQQLMECLKQSIEQALSAHIDNLLHRPRYASLAPQVKPGLQLFYCQGISQAAIAQQLGMTNQSQVSRVLDPRDLLSRVRRLTVEKLLERILERARSLGLTQNPPEPDYLENLMHQLDEFVDEKVFQQAGAEISTSKNRSMSSLYAQHFCHYLKNC